MDSNIDQALALADKYAEELGITTEQFIINYTNKISSENLYLCIIFGSVILLLLIIGIYLFKHVEDNESDYPFYIFGVILAIIFFGVFFFTSLHTTIFYHFYPMQSFLAHPKDFIAEYK